MTIPSFFRSAICRRIPLLLLLPFLAPISTATAAAAEPVFRSDFSNGEADWRLWVPGSMEKKGCSLSAAPDQGKTGGVCLQVESREIACYNVVSKNPVPVEAGQNYRVSVWFRAKEDARIAEGNPGVFLTLALLSAEGKLSGSFLVSAEGKVVSGFPPGDPNREKKTLRWAELPKADSAAFVQTALPREWTQIEAVVQIPDDAKFLRLELMTYRASGTIFWDDIVIEKTGREASASNLEPPATQSFAPATIGDAETFALLDLDLPGLGKVRESVAAGDFTKAKEAYLAYRREQSPARWWITPKAPPAGAAPASDPAADELCENRLRNKESQVKPVDTPVFMGKDFDWDHNPNPKGTPTFTNGWSWSVVGRMGFWNTLAEAYRKTHNEKYAAKWIWFLRDFAQDNPLEDINEDPGQTLLWRTIDSGIRMNSAVPNAYFTFLQSPSFTAEDNWLFLKVVYAHALRLSHALAGHPRRSGNWVNLECRGLYNIGTLFPEFREAAAWRQLAVDRLAKEIDRGLTPDGMQVEFSPSYHYVALGGYRGVVELGDLNNQPVPEHFRAKLLDMYRAPVFAMDQSGEAVCTNDSHAINVREMARKGLQIGPDPILSWAASGGKEGQPLPASTALKYAGFYAMRGGWAPEDLFLFFRGGPLGKGHFEQDMLQIVLKAWGKTLLFDPGRYPYDSSDWRRFAINTAAHNTVIVDGKWQNRSATKIPITEAPDNPWVTTPLFDFVSATYDKGYQMNVHNPKEEYRPQKWVGERVDVTHTRSVLFLRPHYAVVLDSLEGEGRHTFDAHFHMDAPRARLDPGTQAAFSEREDGVQIALFPLDLAHLSTEIIQGRKDPLLGWMPAEHRPIPTVRFRKEQEAPATFATLLYAYKGTTPSVSFKPIAFPPSDGSWRGFSLSSGAESADFVVTGNGAVPGGTSFVSPLAGSVQLQAAGWLARKLPGSSSVSRGAWALQSYREGKLAFSTNRPANLNFSWEEEPAELRLLNTTPDALEVTVTSPFQKTLSLAPGRWTRVTPQTVEETAGTPLAALSRP